MADDWQVGDLALCVFCESGPQVDPWEPKVGETYTVSRVGECDPRVPGLVGLDFIDDPTAGEWLMWKADWFRKIRPDEHTECEPEFVTLLKRSRVSA